MRSRRWLVQVHLERLTDKAVVASRMAEGGCLCGAWKPGERNFLAAALEIIEPMPSPFPLAMARSLVDGKYLKIPDMNNSAYLDLFSVQRHTAGLN